MSFIVLEASKQQYQKKYKCPYCDKRDTRMKLVSHIEKAHSDMIPEGYTATRIVFNLINKKDHGTCVMCGKETEWDENKARYNRFCGSKKCHDAYVKRAHDNTGIEDKLRDPEFQQKMLAGRSISGTYKFSDGSKVSYTGSYEKNLLEFLDKILNVKSEDIESPGPVIEYEYEGQTHKWITDQRYIPYNLVFDVKDGGDNPNNREMADYRKKQIAKEAAIRKQGKYNYIRLTNNDFQQLIEIMMELKEMLMDDTIINKPIIRINEDCTMLMSALPKSNSQDVFIIDYMKKNTFADDKNTHRIGLCKSYMQDAVTVKNGVFENLDFDYLKKMNTHLYRYTGDADFISIIENSEEDTDFYKLLTGKELLDIRQLETDPLFEEVCPYSELMNIMEQAITTTMISSIEGKSSVHYEGFDLPYFELESMNKDNSSVKFYRDINGIFLMNESTGFRTASYSDPDILTRYKRDIIETLS